MLITLHPLMEASESIQATETILAEMTDHKDWKAEYIEELSQYEHVIAIQGEYEMLLLILTAIQTRGNKRIELPQSYLDSDIIMLNPVLD